MLSKTRGSQSGVLEIESMVEHPNRLNTHNCVIRGRYSANNAEEICANFDQFAGTLPVCTMKSRASLAFIGGLMRPILAQTQHRWIFEYEHTLAIITTSNHGVVLTVYDQSVYVQNEMRMRRASISWSPLLVMRVETNCLMVHFHHRSGLLGLFNRSICRLLMYFATVKRCCAIERLLVKALCILQ